MVHPTIGGLSTWCQHWDRAVPGLDVGGNGVAPVLEDDSRT